MSPAPDPARHPYLIGVAGGSCSGKTTVAERLAEMAGDQRVSLIKLDSYYRTFPELPLAERAACDYDHPSAFDWELLAAHVDLLATGRAVPVPVYDYTNHVRSDEVRIVEPSRIVVI